MPRFFLEEMQPLHPRRRWNRAAKNDTTLYGGIGLQKVTDLKGSNECLRIKDLVHHSFKQNWSHRFASSLGDCISWCRLGSADKKGDEKKVKRGGWYQALANGKLLKEDTVGLVISVMESHMVLICGKTCRLSWQLVEQPLADPMLLRENHGFVAQWQWDIIGKRICAKQFNSCWFENINRRNLNGLMVWNDPAIFKPQGLGLGAFRLPCLSLFKLVLLADTPAQSCDTSDFPRAREGPSASCLLSMLMGRDPTKYRGIHWL